MKYSRSNPGIRGHFTSTFLAFTFSGSGISRCFDSEVGGYKNILKNFWSLYLKWLLNLVIGFMIKIHFL